MDLDKIDQQQIEEFADSAVKQKGDFFKDLLAKGLVELGPWLLIEFVPKSDSKVQLLLHTRADIFDTYTEENFKLSFSQYYTLIQEAALPESDRKLFLFKRK
jgi:hypothetical protein